MSKEKHINFNEIQDELSKGPNPEDLESEEETVEDQEESSKEDDGLTLNIDQDELEALASEIAKEYAFKLDSGTFDTKEIFAIYFRILFAMSSLDMVANNLSQLARAVQQQGGDSRPFADLANKTSMVGLILQPLLEKVKNSGAEHTLEEEGKEYQFAISYWLSQEAVSKFQDLIAATRAKSSILGPDGQPAGNDKPSILIP